MAAPPSSANSKILSMARSKLRSKRASSPAIFGLAPDVDDYGVNIGKLKIWSSERQKKLIEQEEIQQEVAISRMRAFVIQIKLIVRIQSWFRSRVQVRIYKQWILSKQGFIFSYLQGWYRFYRTERMYRVRINISFRICLTK